MIALRDRIMWNAPFVVVIVTLLALLLTACGPPGLRCINTGADWTITVASRHDLTAEFIRRGGDYRPNQTCQSGFTDRERKEIWIVGKPGDSDVLREFAHEILIHGPDNAAARIDAPVWDVFYGDAPPEIRAAASALQTAASATAKPR